jgi:sn-glycerol 3-phosphate transport system substrate-binding protein
VSRNRTTIALITAALLLAAACGGGGSSSSGTGSADGASCPVGALDTAAGPVEVVVWHTQQAKPLETMQALADEYNRSQDKVRVRLEAQGASYEELQRKFESAVQSRDLPGIVMFDDTATQTMIDSGVVLPAQACVDADDYNTDDLLDVARQYYTVEDQLWPASANLGNALLYYNRTHFRAAGLDPDDPPTTLAEVRAAAEKIKAAGVAPTPLVHEFAAWKTEFWLTGAQSTMVDNDNGRGDGETTAATLEGNAEATELFDWFKQMQNDGLLLAMPKAEGKIDHYLAMGEQNVSMLIESSSAATSIEAFLGGDLDTSSLGDGTEIEATSGLDIAAGPFPVMREGGQTQMGGSAWYITNTTSDEVQAAAWDFMKFMNEPHAQTQMLIGGSYLPYNRKANDTPEVQQFYTASLSGRWLKIADDEVEEIDPDFPGPLIGPYYDFRKALEASQDELMLSGATPAEALALAQAQVSAALERYAQEGF